MELNFENQYPIAYDDKRKMVHITQVTTENKLKYYYCIACGEILVACAIGEGKKTVPYFRHLSKDKCTEDVIHVCCKNWLFVEGNKVIMIVNGIKKSFVCKSIEIEKRFETPFGEYIPDITITTKTDEQVFVEINHTSKKDETYCAKWEYLKSPVIEVSTKQLFENKFWNTALELTAIFYDGVFTEDFHEKNSRDTYYNLKRDYIRSFSNIEYDKALCQKIFWFWEDTVRYNHGEISKEDFLDVFNALEMREMAYCTAFVESRKCLDIKDELSNICKYKFEKYCENYFKDDYLYNILELKIINWSAMRTSIFLTTSFDSSTHCFNGTPYTYYKKCFKNNNHNDRINHDRYCYIENKYLYDGVLEKIENLEENCIELIYHTKKWKANYIYNIIMMLKNNKFELDILNYYNYIKDQMDKQIDYNNKIDSYCDADNKLNEFIINIDKDKFINNYIFLLKNIEIIKILLNSKNKNIDNDIKKLIKEKSLEDIYLFPKLLKYFNNEISKDYLKYIIKQHNLNLFKQLKNEFQNNNIKNAEFITSKNKFIFNLLDKSKCKDIEYYISLINNSLTIYDKEINNIISNTILKINAIYGDCKLTLKFEKKLENNKFLMFLEYLTYDGEVFNKTFDIPNYLIEKLDYNGIDDFCNINILNHIKKLIPLKFKPIIKNISLYVLSLDLNLHLYIKLIKSVKKDAYKLLIRLKYKNAFLGSISFYQNDNNFDMSKDFYKSNNRYCNYYNYYKEDCLIEVPFEKYTDIQIYSGTINYFKKCIKYNYIKEDMR